MTHYKCRNDLLLHVNYNRGQATHQVAITLSTRKTMRRMNQSENDNNVSGEFLAPVNGNI
jgi:hypothetical protein